ncbi:hypothetical protein AAFC00_006356 [Neodothiora populina]|uniref:Cysteine proteinase n=1 Tax=Neodothiora populina TaxID=2781224 RepID=A0ABR3P4V8_9PEZI
MMSPPYPSSPPSATSSAAFGLRPLSDSTSNHHAANGHSSNGHSSNGHHAPKPYPHISDLQAAAVKDLHADHSLNFLIGEARTSLNNADTLLAFRRPELAYRDYLRCFEILANIIPRHRDQPDLARKHGHQFQAYNDMLKRVSLKTDQYAKIKDIIVNDNKRNGTRPAASTVPTRRQSDATDTTPASSMGHRTSSSDASASHSLPSSGADALNERFARLRMLPPQGKRPDSPLSSYASSQSPRTSLDISNLPASLRPSGPRAMPNASGRPTVQTDLGSSMPKAPAPIYSPARNMQLTGDFHLPRTTARSIVGTGGRSNSAMSAASSHAPGNEGDDSADYFPRPTPERPPPGPPRRKSVHLPKEIRIGPEKLYDYLKMHSILLIDVRSRHEFDDGHIFAQSIVNIDPTSLRRDMSADDVQDSLVLCPDQEQSTFSQRHKFDLVVYYDQDTSSDRFLSRPSTERECKLRYLYDALYEFNQDKPLQRPPILLMGGIESWTDLVGDQALSRSSTATGPKSSAPLRRVPVGSHSSQLYVPKRRLREYNPLDAEEEQKWLERARVESVVVDQKPPLDEEDESQQVDSASPFYDNIEEFNRRFPDAGRLEQSQRLETSSSQAVPRPRIPSYPAPPPRSSFTPSPTVPPVPSRPPPAVSRMSYSGVSDRSLSQSAQNTGSSDLPAYVPPRYLPSNLRLPRTGLVNFGVTCYMNATIQALSATTPLSLFFLDDRFKQQIQRDNWKGSKGVLPELYANLVRSIWKGDVEAIRPTTLRSFCARLNSEWGIDRQQDAKEFLDFLVDCLHEDLNENWSRTPLKALTDQQEEVRESMPMSMVSKTEWSRYTHREHSYLTDLFAGQHASRLRCTTCHFTSTTYEAFYSISVEISRSGRTTLQECLKSYCAEEMLSGDEVWRCPRCKKEREATKQITITRAPQNLVVHFKRFAAGRGERAQKVRTPIEFPLRDLDLEPHMIPEPNKQERMAMSKQYSADQTKQDPSMTAPFLYDAYAVMRHIGTTLTSGHYTCLVKDRARKCWRQFNDTWVADFDPDRLPDRDRLQNEMAYIVFYQRKTDR